MKPGISGTFKDPTDVYDPSRHKIKANLSMGTKLAAMLAQVKVEKIQRPVAEPKIVEFWDVTSDTANTTLTPGGLAEVFGQHLKFDPANPDDGIYFIDSANTETKVTVVSTRTETRLTLTIPATLATGTYTLEIRRAYTQNNTIRKAIM